MGPYIPRTIILIACTEKRNCRSRSWTTKARIVRNKSGSVVADVSVCWSSPTSGGSLANTHSGIIEITAAMTRTVRGATKASKVPTMSGAISCRDCNVAPRNALAVMIPVSPTRYRVSIIVSPALMNRPRPATQPMSKRKSGREVLSG
jgi:hypothetical protein